MEGASALNSTVKFSINYKTNPGEVLYIAGNINELGSWKSPVQMNWTDGHNWVRTIDLTSPFFQYKYLVGGTKQSQKWEDGINRIGDVRLMSKSNDEDEFLTQEDKWETFSINFYMLKQRPLLRADECMRINGNIESLGAWNKGGPVKMSKEDDDDSENDENFDDDCDDHRGRQSQMWTYSIDVGQKLYKELELRLKDIEYRYSVRNDERNCSVWEREPTRHVRIMSPETYLEESSELPQLSAQFNMDAVYIINGVVTKMDRTFRDALDFDKIKHQNIFIGCYIQSDANLQDLVEQGINGVLNLQSDEELAHFDVNWDAMTDQFREYGIVSERAPIKDFDEADLKRNLLDATNKLIQMVNDQGLKVYVSCTAGMGLSPAVVVAYLVIHEGMDPDVALSLVQESRSVAEPNIKAIKELLA